MDKSQYLIDLFFKTNDKEVEQKMLTQIRFNNERPKDLYEQYKASIRCLSILLFKGVKWKRCP